MTPAAVAVSVNRVDFGEHPALSQTEQTALADRMRQAYGTPLHLAPPADPPATETATAEAPAEEPPPRSSTARPDPTRPAATQSAKPARPEALRDW